MSELAWPIVQFQTEEGWVRIRELWEKQLVTKEYAELCKILKFGVNQAKIEQDTVI